MSDTHSDACLATIERGAWRCSCGFVERYDKLHPSIKCYRVTTKGYVDDGAERSGLYDATSSDEARAIVVRSHRLQGEDITIVSVECLDQ